MIALDEIKKAKRGAVARALTLVEDDPKKARGMLKKIFKSCGKATVIGVTGPAGAGKSSLIGKVAVKLAQQGRRPAILAIDPTSHITGGAIMGDRARMVDLEKHRVYLRSMASRGSTGAVSASLRDCIRVLEYARYDPIIVESVGAGQTDVDISSASDITIVVFSPNTGDSIQAIKAGLTEIGDIYLVNKSDLQGASQLYESLKEFVGSGVQGQDDVTILQTSVKRQASITRLTEHISRITRAKKKGKKERYMASLESEMRDIVLNGARERAASTMTMTNSRYARCVRALRSGTSDPYGAAQKILEEI